jgi:hypothetical protein
MTSASFVLILYTSMIQYPYAITSQQWPVPLDATACAAKVKWWEDYGPAIRSGWGNLSFNHGVCVPMD